ncbi:MAG: lecithin--cholesterol acyltransferase [Xenococcaceae cyanobacterium]
MPRTPMIDMVVLLPGIMGSVLQDKNGRDIWNLSCQAAFKATREIITQGSLLQELMVQEDDPERDYLDDGIKATGLIQDAYLLPGFIKIADGYSSLRKRLVNNFDLTHGKNYFEFAYDWRRDNRVAARLLKKLIDENLPQWQEKNPEAKVILIAHSMGGLISRYYLEHLGGGEHCKALFTLGTPYRGSVKILNFLANGYKKKPLPALTDVLRSFTSAYQLLSMYPVVNVDGNWQRIAEANGIPGVDTERARQAREFLQQINLPEHLKYTNSYVIKPIIGVGQKSTYQSAKLSNGKLEVSKNTLPEIKQTLDVSFATGDDTVPILSVIPVDLDGKLREVGFAETHGALQNNDHIWSLLKDDLKRLQNITSDFQNPLSSESKKHPAAISLSVDDLYLRDEEVRLGAEIMNVDSETLAIFGGLRARIAAVSGNGEESKPQKFPLEQQEDSFYELTLEPNKLAPGLYCLEVETSKAHKQAPKSVHTLFAIAE